MSYEEVLADSTTSGAVIDIDTCNDFCAFLLCLVPESFIDKVSSDREA